MKIALSKPHLTNVERDYVTSAFADGWISGTGPHVSEFENRVSLQTGRRYTLAVSSGTAALELSLRGLGVGPGDEVIVPSLTFAAPASSVVAVGASVVLADVSPESWTLDPAAVRANLSERTSAIIAVDLMGHPADYDELAGFGVPVIQDAAQAHGAMYGAAPVGAQGVVSTFSYHANKAITTGEGGSVCTDSAELAERMRLIMNHGMSTDRPYVHSVVGRNFRITNLAAAIGLGQMDRWDELTSNRTEISRYYTDRLAPLGCASRPVASWAKYSCWLHVISLARAPRVVQLLRDRKVDARSIWPPLHRQPFLGLNQADEEYPVSSAISDTTIWLPTYSGMTAEELDFVAACVTDVMRQIKSE